MKQKKSLKFKNLKNSGFTRCLVSYLNIGENEFTIHIFGGKKEWTLAIEEEEVKDYTSLEAAKKDVPRAVKEVLVETYRVNLKRISDYEKENKLLAKAIKDIK